MHITYREKSLNLSIPKIMGILNVTPDSFYDGGKQSTFDSALKKAELLISEGADIIDVGGYSSRPGADHISVETEIKRVIPVIRELAKIYPEQCISIDTFRSEVASAAMDEGAFMVNDISGGKLDPEMFNFISDGNIPYVLMHLRGTPQNMKDFCTYNNLIKDVYNELAEQLTKLNKQGANQVMIDLGFGFSKTIDQNYTLLNDLNTFKALNCPILTGISRKSMIYKTLNTNPEKALNGTTALNMVALLNGSSILRVHDVAEAVEVRKLQLALKGSTS